jgi:hypothetical protein
MLIQVNEQATALNDALFLELLLPGLAPSLASKFESTETLKTLRRLRRALNVAVFLDRRGPSGLKLSSNLRKVQGWRCRRARSRTAWRSGTSATS